MSKFDESLERLKGWLTNPLSKIEGTFSMFNLRAVAQESALVQNKIEIVEDNLYLDSAHGVYLDNKCQDYGTSRHLAQPSQGQVVFSGVKGTVIPVGTVLLAPDFGVRFFTTLEATIGDDGTCTVDVQSETFGAGGNVPENAVNKMAKPIAGIASVNNTAAFDGGMDRESDGSLRYRTQQKNANPATSGNKQCYINWAMEVQGVGAVKVFSKKDMLDLGMDTSKNNVKVSIIDGNKEPASSELLQKVKDHIDPTDGRGDGQAPVGATVAVTTASGKRVDISAKVDLGTKGDLQAVKTEFEKTIKEFLHEIAYDGKTKNISVALIGFRLLQTAGVVDYTELTLNGGTSPIAIGIEEVLQLGTINLIEAGA